MPELSGLRRTGLVGLVTVLAAGCASISGVAPAAAPAPSATLPPPPTVGQLAALDSATGTLRWKVPLPIDTISAPVTADGVVVVDGTRDCKLPYLTVVAYRVDTGKIAWRTTVPSSEPCSFQTAIYTSGGVIIAGGPAQTTQGLTRSCSAHRPRLSPAVGLNPATGRRRWKEPATGGAILAVTASTVLTDGTGFPCLSGFSAATGRSQWARPDTQGAPIATGGPSSAFQNSGASTDVVLALDPATGKVRWRRLVAGPAFNDTLTVIGNVVVDVATKSAFNLPIRARTVPAASASAAPATGFTEIRLDRTTITAFAASTGHQLWRTTYTENHTAVSSTTDALLVLHSAGRAPNTLEAVDPLTGVRRWLASPVDGQQLTDSIAPSPVDVTRTETAVTGYDAATGAIIWTSTATADEAFVAGGNVFLTRAAQPAHPIRGN
ncbi:hypothetical protein acdb102_20570 [Acidothermaceae bacterium B102]|nr:hypothetical protein acdb102_20570 [Acidothermaceae bacterium B102]